jgi:hypothetical protein
MAVQRLVAVSTEAVVMAMIVIVPVLVTGALSLGLTWPRLGATRPAEQREQAPARPTAGRTQGLTGHGRGAVELLERHPTLLAAILVDRHVFTPPRAVSL